MDKEKAALQSLVLDLKRVALGFYKGSDKTAERFVQEALKRRGEIHQVEPYISKILEKLPKALSERNKQKLAEDALTYSVILQNYALKNLKY